MSNFTLLMIGVAILIVALVLGTPVPYSFGFAVIYMVAVFGYPESTIVPVGFAKMGSMTFLAMPMFILVGSIMERGKIGEAMIGWVEMLVGKLRGGLGIVSVVSSAVFGAICGSSAATLSCIGGIMYPKLREQGWEDGFATALVLNAAPLGLLIPPSSTMILYAWLSGESVLACFAATVVPGIILATFLCILTYFEAKKNPKLDPKALQAVNPTPALFSKAGWARTRFAFPALLMPIIVLGGIYGGIVSPTEAAGVSVVYALLIGVVAYREINFKKFIKCLVDTGHTATPVMLILGICIVFGRVLSMLRIPQTLATFVTSNIESKIAVLLAINLFLLVAGMLMDTIPCILILAPIFLPIVQAYNVDIVHFGILMTCNLAIGFVTPPIGTNLFVAQSLTKIPITRIAKHAVPFLAMFLVALLVITFVPSVSLWLPSVLSK